MNRVDGVWANGGVKGVDADVAARGRAEVVEVVLAWRDARSQNVLGRCEVKAGASLALGERGELMVPAEVLGAERVEVVRFDGDRATVTAPAGAKLRVDGWPREEREVELARGHAVELFVGAFVVRFALTRQEQRIALSPMQRLRGAGLGVILGSAFFHAALFATIAYVSPALGATEEDAYDDADRVALMQRMLNASAEQEKERTPADAPQDATGGDVNAGQPARGAEGVAGAPTAPERSTRWAARGTATPETATLPKEAELQQASQFGLIGMLATAQAMNAPTSPWGSTLNGSDDVNAVGKLYGGSIDDSLGTLGWGFGGLDMGGGGTANAIGLNGIGGLGHTGSCVGGKPCSGIGVGYGQPGHGYVPKPPRMPREGGIQTNGRLPPEVIQRVVRQNFGRFTACYQSGLRSNPSLEGRVAVKFVIGRDGTVQLAADGGSDMPDAGVRQCVIASFTGLSFPAPENGMVTVVYPLVFSPE